MITRTKVNNRLTKLFEEKKNDLLNIYFTAGFPRLEETLPVMEALQDAGADMIELGMPYSDPLADGPVIQESSQTALKNGMNMQKLFQQLENMREKIHIPVLLMGYVNPVMQFGIENFLKKAAETGVDGLILPDLPLPEYRQNYQADYEKNNLSSVFLVTPQTTEERVKAYDEVTTGFIYVVSTASTTGGTKDIRNSEAFFRRLNSYKLQNPTMIGFNIRDHKSYAFANQYSNGAIIGSAFIKMLKESTDLKKDIKSFVKSVKKG